MDCAWFCHSAVRVDANCTGAGWSTVYVSLSFTLLDTKVSRYVILRHKGQGKGGPFDRHKLMQLGGGISLGKGGPFDRSTHNGGSRL